MRCTRCDRPAVPQAIGRTPEGTLVFGWCLDCLTATGCIDIEVSRPVPQRAVEMRGCPIHEDSIVRARRRAAGTALILFSVWPLLLGATGAWIVLRRANGQSNPFGNGTPMFFFGGAAASALVLAILGLAIFGGGWLRSPRTLRIVRWAFFALGVVILTVGIARHSPKRDPYFATAALLALGIAGGARRLERTARNALVIGAVMRRAGTETGGYIDPPRLG